MHACAAITRRVLVLSSDTTNSKVIEDALRPWMFETVVCSSVLQAADRLAQKDFALIISEERFEGGAYPELLSLVQNSSKVPIVVMISNAGADGDSVFREAMALGAFAVVANPCSPNDVKWMVIQATQGEAGSSKSRAGSRSMSTHASHGLQKHK